MATTAQEMPENLALPFLTLAERNRAVFEKLARVIQEETLHFLNQNVERNVHALERLRECRGISGFMEVEREWLTGMVRDSVEQTQRLSNAWWRLAEEEANDQSEAMLQAAPARAEGKAERHRTSEDRRAAA